MSRRIVATATSGIIDKASVVAAAEIIIGFVAQPLEQSERGGLSLCPTLRKEYTLFGEVDRWTDRNDS